MIIVLREKYLHQATRESYVAMASQRSGRMLSVGAKRLPSFGGPLATLAIVLLATLAIKYVKRLIRAGSSVGRAAPATQGRSEVRPPSGPRRKTPTTRGVVTITETTAPTSERLNKLALTQYAEFVKAVHNEATSRLRDGYVGVTEMNNLFRQAGLPLLVGHSQFSLEVPISYTVKAVVREHDGDRRKDESDRDYVLRRLRAASDGSHWRFNDMVGEIAIDEANIKGLPSDKDQDAYTEPADADEALARIDKAKALLLAWVREQVAVKGRWCDDGATTSLRRAGVGALGKRTAYTVTRETGAGTATHRVYAYSPEQAAEIANAQWTTNGVSIAPGKIKWVDGSEAVVTPV